MLSEDTIRAALSGIAGPDGRTPLAGSGALGGIVIRDDRVFVSLEIDPAFSANAEVLRGRVERAVRAVPGVGQAFVTLTAQRAAAQRAAAQGASGSAPPAGPGQGGSHHHHGSGPRAQAARTPQAVEGVRRIVAVASGKGGVGKSTTAANLALALAATGLRVAILDADIYGPSMPRLLGLKDKPEVIEGRLMRPLEAFGLKVMSIGFLVEEETAMIWRGPMVMSAITQMLREVAWGEVDVMVVDMPPGTGDAQLTLAQSVPLAGAVIVSTPQDLALIDARRGIAMFRRVEVPILGIVENMSTFVCPHCGEKSEIFGHGGARREAGRLGVPYLGDVPLALDIRTTSDEGRPVVASDPGSVHARAYAAIAGNVLEALGASRGRAAPRIVVEP